LPGAGGVRLGRPVKIDRYREDVVKLRAQGLTGRAIAKELRIPSFSSFRIIGKLGGRDVSSYVRRSPL
jgi:hypothetical protein